MEQKLRVEREALRAWAKSLPIKREEEKDACFTATNAPSTMVIGEGTVHDGEEGKRNTHADEAKDQQKQERALEALVKGMLPKELVMLVLEHVVDSEAAQLDLRKEDGLSSTSKRLLGTSAAAEALHPLLEQLILERSRLRLDMTFTRRGGGREPVAQPPPFVAHLQHSLRHLELVGHLEIRPHRLAYPLAIFTLTRGMASVARAFPDLRSFTLLLNLNVMEDLNQPVASALNARCFCGYTTTTTYRELVLNMLMALHHSRVAQQTRLKLAFDSITTWKRSEGDEVTVEPAREGDTAEERTAMHPMKHVLDKASQVHEMRTASRQPPTSSPYQERVNDDMVMLEDENAIA